MELETNMESGFTHNPTSTACLALTVAHGVLMNQLMHTVPCLHTSVNLDHLAHSSFSGCHLPNCFAYSEVVSPPLTVYLPMIDI